MAATLQTKVDLLRADVSDCSRVHVRPEFDFVSEAPNRVLQGCVLQGNVLQGNEPTRGLSIDAGAYRTAADAAMKGYWFHAPKFGTTNHSQRWRFET